MELGCVYYRNQLKDGTSGGGDVSAEGKNAFILLNTLNENVISSCTFEKTDF